MIKYIDNSQDILDSRDIFERIEELEDAKDAFEETIKEWEDEILDLDSEDEDEAKEKFEIQEKMKSFGTWEESSVEYWAR